MYDECPRISCSPPPPTPTPIPLRHTASTRARTRARARHAQRVRGAGCAHARAARRQAPHAGLIRDNERPARPLPGRSQRSLDTGPLRAHLAAHGARGVTICGPRDSGAGRAGASQGPIAPSRGPGVPGTTSPRGAPPRRQLPWPSTAPPSWPQAVARRRLTHTHTHTPGAPRRAEAACASRPRAAAATGRASLAPPGTGHAGPWAGPWPWAGGGTLSILPLLRPCMRMVAS